MPTFKDIQKRIFEQLQSFGIETSEARRESELIIEHATGCSLSHQIAYADDELEPHAVSVIAGVVAQRQKRMPLQYCLGHAWFMGLKFSVSPAVLIPRADTETLVELAVNRLQKSSTPRFIDIGIGSGAIAVSILKILKTATAVGIDVSADALIVAAQNARKLGVEDRLQLVHCDWVSFASQAPFDAVISNPPYIPPDQMADLAPEVSDHEPPQALYGLGEDGLGFFRNICDLSARHLIRGGFVAVEVGQGQAERVSKIFSDGNWRQIETYRDLNGIARCISAVHAD